MIIKLINDKILFGDKTQVVENENSKFPIILAFFAKFLETSDHRNLKIYEHSDRIDFDAVNDRNGKLIRVQFKYGIPVSRVDWFK